MFLGELNPVDSISEVKIDFRNAGMPELWN